MLASLKTIILRFVRSIRFVKYVFSVKHGSWRLQLESWNTNHELLNRTLLRILFCHRKEHWCECVDNHTLSGSDPSDPVQIHQQKHKNAVWNLFKVINKGSIAMSLTWRHYTPVSLRRSDLFIVNFQLISLFILVFLFLIWAGKSCIDHF